MLQPMIADTAGPVMYGTLQNLRKHLLLVRSHLRKLLLRACHTRERTTGTVTGCLQSAGGSADG
jgi:hypothetical protein